MDNQLIKNLLAGKYQRAKEHDFSDGIGGTVQVYTVGGATSFCKLWNNGENKPFNVAGACKEVVIKLLDDEDAIEGEVYLGFATAGYEVVEK